MVVQLLEPLVEPIDRQDECVRVADMDGDRHDEWQPEWTVKKYFEPAPKTVR